MNGYDPIDRLARRAATAVEDAARSRVAAAPDPDELRAVGARRHVRQRIAAGVAAVAGAVALFAVGTGLLPGTPGLWIENVLGGVDEGAAFVGEWESIDLDGSNQTLTIGRRGVDSFDVALVDDHSTACGGGPATASGVGTLADPTTLAVTWEYVCEDGTVIGWHEGFDLREWRFVHDEAADVLTDVTEVVWFRPGAPRPTIEGADSWTVETPLGGWTWSWIPHAEGAQRLYQEAVARIPRGRPFPTDDELPDHPGPQVAGLRWEPGFPVQQAEAGDARVVVLEVRGELDPDTLEWVDMPAIDVGHHWRMEGSGRRLELYDDFWAPPVAVLSPGLASDDGSVVEFRELETGVLAFRLRSVDATAPAEHLAAGLWVVWDLLVEDLDGFRVVEPPWRGLPVSTVQVASDTAGFVAVALGPGDDSRTDGALHAWRSPDGVEWEPLGASVPVDGTTAGQLVAAEDLLLLFVGVEQDEWSRTGLWASTDGATWNRVLPGLGGFPRLWQTGFGWVLTDMTGVCPTSVSADGVAWSRIPFQPEVEVRSNVEAVQCAVIDDEVYIQLEEPLDDDFRPLGLWIGRLDP